MDKDEEIRELRSRLDAIQPPGKAPPPRRSGCLLFAILGVVLFVGFAVASTIGDAAEEVEAAKGPKDWAPPAGYQAIRTDNRVWVGVEWVRPARSECIGGRACFAMNVVTEKPCPTSLYAAVKLLGENGDNIGWTNDTAQGVDAGERVRLVFETYERGARSAAIAEMSCY